MSCHNKKNELQKAVDQLGKDTVEKSIGVPVSCCDVHGCYVGDTCPLCPKANGTGANDVEHFIDMNPMQQLGTNPQQKLNPFGI